MNVHFSQTSEDWATPQDVFDKLNEEFHFTLDAAASAENAKCDRFFDKNTDGLKQDWSGERVYVNPPYNRYTMGAWLAKMAECKADVCVALLPARTNTSWFHDFILGKAEIRFIRGKLKFNGYKWEAPFPNIIVVFRRQN